jgi:hypothetical protein
MKMKMRIFRIVCLSIMSLALTTTALAAGTPTWWDNPGNTYSTWSVETDSGTVSNNEQGLITSTVTVDTDGCPFGENDTEVWVQIEWTPSDLVSVTLKASNSLFSAVEWSDEACPATPSTSIVGTAGYGLGFFTEEGTFSPLEHESEGVERSYTINSVPSCVRVNTSWDVEPQHNFDYHIEVQKVCTGPNAVVLSGFSGRNWGIAMFGILSLAALSSVIVGKKNHS